VSPLFIFLTPPLAFYTPGRNMDSSGVRTIVVDHDKPENQGGSNIIVFRMDRMVPVDAAVKSEIFSGFAIVIPADLKYFTRKEFRGQDIYKATLEPDGKTVRVTAPSMQHVTMDLRHGHTDRDLDHLFDIKEDSKDKASQAEQELLTRFKDLGGKVSKDKRRLTRTFLLDFTGGDNQSVDLNVLKITGKSDRILPFKIYDFKETVKVGGETYRGLRPYVVWRIARTDQEGLDPSPEKKQKASAMASRYDAEDSDDEDMTDGGGGRGGTMNDDGGYDGGFDE